MIRLRSHEQGFSLIEIVVSLGIIGIVLVIYAAAANTMSLNQSARNKQLAYRIANSSIEQLRGTAYASLPASVTITDPLLARLPHGASGSVTVTTYNAKTKQVTSTVTWKDPASAAQRTVTLTTLITEGGLGQ